MVIKNGRTKDRVGEVNNTRLVDTDTIAINTSNTIVITIEGYIVSYYIECITITIQGDIVRHYIIVIKIIIITIVILNRCHMVKQV